VDATYLVPNTMTSSKLDSPARTSSHGINGSKLATQSRIKILTLWITSRSHEPGNKIGKRLECQRIRVLRRALRSAVRFDAVIYRTHTCAQPYRFRCS
jgi:hypothetical protein